MKLKRTLKHLFATPAGTRRRFTRATQHAITQAIRAGELRSSGEIRFVIETALELGDLWAGSMPRLRAQQVFSDLHIWNTELRNGVLIYISMADRDVEIVADRGAAALIPPASWEAVCRLMEDHFRAGRFTEGAIGGVEAVAGLLERHFPRGAADRNELPNQPVLL